MNVFLSFSFFSFCTRSVHGPRFCLAVLCSLEVVSYLCVLESVLYLELLYRYIYFYVFGPVGDLQSINSKSEGPRVVPSLSRHGHEAWLWCGVTGEEEYNPFDSHLGVGVAGWVSVADHRK